jgi:hypothetical protein
VRISSGRLGEPLGIEDLDIRHVGPRVSVCASQA